MSRVLIVEDDPRDMLLIRSVIEGKYQIAVATTLDEAVKQMIKETPDAVLLDVGLPDAKNPEHAIARMKEYRNDKAAIVVVSGCDDPEQIASGIEKNADGWVVKGLSMASGILHQLERGIANYRICCKVETGITHLTTARTL